MVTAIMRSGAKSVETPSTPARELPTPKYVIRKSDGSPPDPGARYLVLRLDTDPYAREAAESYAECVALSDPGLAEAVRRMCAPTVRPDWSLPPAPRCKCGGRSRAVAIGDVGSWSLAWECLACCEPTAGPRIPWPFVERIADGPDFDRVGLAWDYA